MVKGVTAFATADDANVWLGILASAGAKEMRLQTDPLIVSGNICSEAI
jgi:hypothetical protein